MEFLTQPRLEYSSCVLCLFRTLGAEMNSGKHLCILAYSCSSVLEERVREWNILQYGWVGFPGHRQEDAGARRRRRHKTEIDRETPWQKLHTLCFVAYLPMVDTHKKKNILGLVNWKLCLWNARNNNKLSKITAASLKMYSNSQYSSEMKRRRLTQVCYCFNLRMTSLLLRKPLIVIDIFTYVYMWKWQIFSAKDTF